MKLSQIEWKMVYCFFCSSNCRAEPNVDIEIPVRIVKQNRNKVFGDSTGYFH